jgi:hypothetical protein
MTSSVSCGELLHQVRLRVQAAGRVDEDDVPPAALGSGDRVVRDRGGVASFRRADEVGPGALRPDLELLVGGRAERICGGDEDRAAVLGKAVGELADRRRLAGAVDADDEYDARAVVHRERGRLAEQGRDLLHQCLRQVVDVTAPAEPLDEFVRRGHAHVGGDQCLLELLPRFVVARVKAPERQADRGACTAEGAAEPPEEPPALVLGLGDPALVTEQL